MDKGTEGQDITIRQLQVEAHTTAYEKGWWDKPRSVGDLIALCHSELSEALEVARESPLETPPPSVWHNREDGGPEGFPIELADLLIRVADMAECYKIDLTRALRLKLAYNKTRPYRHGGKSY